jgi:ABC-type lipoprotein release transport system permease subunit
MRTELVRTRVKAALRAPRGQAMAEYSAVVFALATAGGVAIITVVPLLMNALDRYLQGIYFMLNLAIP